MIVVDASVAVKWVLREPDSDAALALLNGDRNLMAPDIVLMEVASAITRSHRMNLIDAAAVDLALTSWHAITLIGVPAMHPFGPLLPAAAALAVELRHPLADCLYLALATRLGVPLVTTDATFAARAGQRHAIATLEC